MTVAIDAHARHHVSSRRTRGGLSLPIVQRSAIQSAVPTHGDPFIDADRSSHLPHTAVSGLKLRRELPILAPGPIRFPQ
jgi:hypothetical protein